MTSCSLYSDERVCFICGSPVVHRHHIYPGNGRRGVSEREGAWVYLCPNHHNMSDRGVHFDKELDSFFRTDCQRRWEEREGVSDHDAFLRTFGISYL